eukprot:SAG31_NODE_42261_length_272_cov_0.895954_1_plen_44_part_10
MLQCVVLKLNLSFGDTLVRFCVENHAQPAARLPLFVASSMRKAC